MSGAGEILTTSTCWGHDCILGSHVKLPLILFIVSARCSTRGGGRWGLFSLLALVRAMIVYWVPMSNFFYSSVNFTTRRCIRVGGIPFISTRQIHDCMLGALVKLSLQYCQFYLLEVIGDVPGTQWGSQYRGRGAECPP